MLGFCRRRIRCKQPPPQGVPGHWRWASALNGKPMQGVEDLDQIETVGTKPDETVDFDEISRRLIDRWYLPLPTNDDSDTGAAAAEFYDSDSENITGLTVTPSEWSSSSRMGPPPPSIIAGLRGTGPDPLRPGVINIYNGGAGGPDPPGAGGGPAPPPPGVCSLVFLNCHLIHRLAPCVGKTTAMISSAIVVLWM